MKYHFGFSPDAATRTNLFAFEETNSQSDQIGRNGHGLLEEVDLLAFTSR